MLPAGSVHLYYLDTRGIQPGAELLSLLPADERNQHDRFLFDRDRRTYLWAHAMTRLLLGRYTGSNPASLVFERNAYGKPALPGIGFNLSHTTGMVVCGLGPVQDIGVDVEDTTRSNNWRALARTVFSRRELERVDSAERFYELWTLKEAYIKARGMGLSIPLQEFTIVTEGGRIQVDVDPPWHFELFPIEEFRVSVAIRGEEWTVQLLDAAGSLASELGLAF
jgi:4'-phosphopantetheinyl transferase